MRAAGFEPGISVSEVLLAFNAPPYFIHIFKGFSSKTCWLKVSPYSSIVLMWLIFQEMIVFSSNFSLSLLRWDGLLATFNHQRLNIFRFPLHFMLYGGNLVDFFNSVSLLSPGICLQPCSCPAWRRHPWPGPPLGRCWTPGYRTPHTTAITTKLFEFRSFNYQ